MDCPDGPYVWTVRMDRTCTYGLVWCWGQKPDSLRVLLKLPATALRDAWHRCDDESRRALRRFARQVPTAVRRKGGGQMIQVLRDMERARLAGDSDRSRSDRQRVRLLEEGIVTDHSTATRNSKQAVHNVAMLRFHTGYNPNVERASARKEARKQSASSVSSKKHDSKKHERDRSRSERTPRGERSHVERVPPPLPPRERTDRDRERR
ncbi:MAG: hypothetical protein MHM6MM_008772 [Cercozoa sp. M6MM]